MWVSGQWQPSWPHSQLSSPNLILAYGVDSQSTQGTRENGSGTADEGEGINSDSQEKMKRIETYSGVVLWILWAE